MIMIKKKLIKIKNNESSKNDKVENMLSKQISEKKIRRR